MEEKLREMGKIIREYREKKNMPQEELALKLGVSIATVSYYEVGARMPTLERILQIASILEIPEPLLLGFTGQNSDGKGDVDTTLRIALRSKGLETDDITNILGLVGSLSKLPNDKNPNQSKGK